MFQKLGINTVLLETQLNDKGQGVAPATYKANMQDAINNIKDFCASLISGQYLDNAEESAKSTMTAILGRMAAYGEKKVTWEDMLAANESLDAHLLLPNNGPVTPREKP